MGMRQVNRFRGAFALRAAASGLGLGYAPFAPGTLGALLALPFWYWGGGRGPVHFLSLGAVVLLAVPAARVEMRETGKKDPPSVVIDEVAGMLLAATGIPWGWKTVLVLFALFRFFDIVKWGPMAWLNSREGAVYVVADDLAAGLFANVACRGIFWLAG